MQIVHDFIYENDFLCNKMSKGQPFTLEAKADFQANSGSHMFSHYISTASKVNALTRPDESNFCLLLCQALEKFPQLAESKSRDIVPLFFTFLRQVNLCRSLLIIKKIIFMMSNKVQFKETCLDFIRS